MTEEQQQQTNVSRTTTIYDVQQQIGDGIQCKWTSCEESQWTMPRFRVMLDSCCSLFGNWSHRVIIL